MKTNIVIYGRENCHYCRSAKDFCDQYYLNYEYIDIEMMEPQDRHYLLTTIAPGAKTIPIIIHGGVWIGGFSDLVYKETKGSLHHE